MEEEIHGTLIGLRPPREVFLPLVETVKEKLLSLDQKHIFSARVGILKQNAKSWYSGIPGFEVRRNSKTFFCCIIFVNIPLCQHCKY
jgi:hypothetical protein